MLRVNPNIKINSSFRGKSIQFQQPKQKILNNYSTKINNLSTKTINTPISSLNNFKVTNTSKAFYSKINKDAPKTTVLSKASSFFFSKNKTSVVNSKLTEKMDSTVKFEATTAIATPTATKSVSRIKWDLGFSSLVSEWKSMVSPKYLLDDTIAGLTVACIAIPLSLAIALASGLPPAVGMVSAVVGGFAGALFGGTRLAVTGPAAAMSILVATAVAQHGLAGLLTITLCCGVLQVLTGVFKLGSFAKLVPAPVIAGFTTGVGALILLGQLTKIFNLPPLANSHATVFESLTHVFSNIHLFSPTTVAVCAFTYAVITLLPKLFPKVPSAIVGVIASTAVCAAFGITVPLIGEIPSSFPLPSLPTIPTLAEAGHLASIGFMVYALASIESLLSSAALDKLTKTKEKHDPDQELIGQGLSNVLSSLFSGAPCTSVIARSTLNYTSGGKTRRASAIHAGVLFLTVVAFAPYMSIIPTAALSAVLLTISKRMLSPSEIKSLTKINKSEIIPYGVTLTTMLAMDLVVGIAVGTVVSGAIAFMKNGNSINLLKIEKKSEGEKMIKLSGPINFLSTFKIDKLKEILQEETATTNNDLIIDMSDVNYIDSTGGEQVAEILHDFHIKVKGLSEENKNALIACHKELASLMI